MHEHGREATIISSRHHPLVARFREAARGGADTPLLLDGPHLVVEALDARLPMLDVAMASARVEDPEFAAIRQRVPAVHLVTGQVLDALSPTRTPSGVVALATRPVVSADRMFSGPAPLVVIAVGVQDPGNLGAIVRSAEAGGASGVLTTADGADPFGWKAVRGSMGSVLRLPVLRLPDASAAVALARGHGLRCLAAVRHGGTPMTAARLDGPLALIVGGEGPGLDPSIVEGSDARISIPMSSPVESLNVGTAAALLVYEARRQRAGR